eukprot:3178727-Amphidinium_carterae.1
MHFMVVPCSRPHVCTRPSELTSRPQSCPCQSQTSQTGAVEVPGTIARSGSAIVREFAHSRNTGNQDLEPRQICPFSKNLALLMQKYSACLQGWSALSACG